MNGRMVGKSDQPVICTPVVGKTKEEILAELSCVVMKTPDIIEWRADFYDGISDTDKVLEVARTIKKTVGDTPVIFTVRSYREGGQPIALTEKEIMELNAAVCTETAVEYVDFELSNEPGRIIALRAIAHANGKKLIASFHEYGFTPAREALLQKFIDAENYDADVAKVAVMPREMEDVLTLLGVTLEAKKRIGIPLIAISLGSYGAVTRLIGGVFGSSASFAVGHTASAPGQIPINDLRTVLNIIEKTMKQ